MFKFSTKINLEICRFEFGPPEDRARKVKFLIQNNIDPYAFGPMKKRKVIKMSWLGFFAGFVSNNRSVDRFRSSEIAFI